MIALVVTFPLIDLMEDIMNKLILIISLVLFCCLFFIGCSDEDSLGSSFPVEIGSLVAPVLPNLDTVLTANADVTTTNDQFVVYYYRPDGDYSAWSLWLWSTVKGGAQYSFSGTTNGVAYYVGNMADFFNESTRVLGIIVRTDSWVKDPGMDQFFCIDNGNRFVVFSGVETVYPVESLRPRILKAVLFEEPVSSLNLRLTLSHKYGLPLSISNAGFTISGGLIVVDARNFDYRKSDNRTQNLADDVFISFTGTITNTNSYYISHPAFSNAMPVSFAGLPSETPELSTDDRNKLPQPVLDNHPQWVDLYWASWKFMREKITTGNVANGFAASYIDEGFNENIYQWDSCFMVAYAIYGLDVFPAMATLDNFYNHQRASDGYICRCYNESTGLATGENDINPPLFAWMEWRYYKLTGDASRLSSVLPVLDKYYTWVKDNSRSANGGGLYYITDLGSGMDNSPRESYVQQGAWIDLSSQQALAALYITRLATAAGDATLQSKYQTEYDSIKALINSYLWNAGYSMYYDRKENGDWHVRNTIASFWPMLAEVADGSQATLLINNHLKNPAEFYRPHLFPTLAANDPLYDPSGHYWRGGVWAPTDFAVIKGIAIHDRSFAFEAAVNHIGNMSSVYHDFDPAVYQYSMPSLSEPNIPRNGDGINQIWETYSPEVAAPATRWDATLLVRQKFCGWSGVGPVALLIENVIGLDINGAENSMGWDIRLLERHGLQNFKLGEATVSLVAESRTSSSETIVINGTTTASFTLKVYNAGSLVYDQTVSGSFTLNITP